MNKCRITGWKSYFEEFYRSEFKILIKRAGTWNSGKSESQVFSGKRGLYFKSRCCMKLRLVM